MLVQHGCLIGVGSGKNRAVDAAKQALASTLLDVSIAGAKALIFYIVAGGSLTLYEVNEAAEVIKQALDPEANIIFGVAQDSTLKEEVRITIIATGFVAKLGMAGVDRTSELKKLLEDLKSKE